MRSFKPLQIFTLVFFVLLLGGFVAFRSGVFDKSEKKSSTNNNQELIDTLKIPPPNDSPTIKIDTPKINPNLLPSSKSLVIYDKYKIQKHQLNREIIIEDSIRNSLHNAKIDTTKKNHPSKSIYMGSSKSAMIFDPKFDSILKYLLIRPDSLNLRVDTLKLKNEIP